MSFATVLLIVAALCAACGDEVGVFIFQGKLAPELRMEAKAYVEARRDILLCKTHLLANPSRAGESIEGTFRRIGSDRYELRFDLRDAPQGGFCQYALRWVLIDVGERSDRALTLSFARFIPEYSLKGSGWWKPLHRPEAVMTSTCGYGPPPHEYGFDCEKVERTVPDFYGDKTFELNVGFNYNFAPPAEGEAP